MVNPDSIPRYAEPPQEPEPTPAQWMARCCHCKACERLWYLFVGPISGKPDSQMADTIDCSECKEYES